MGKRALLSLFGLIISLILGHYAWGQNLEVETARIIRIKGTVMVCQRQGKKWLVARKGMTVFQKDIVKTLSGSEVDLLIQDYAVIRLKENSLLDLAEIKREAKKPVPSPKILRVEKVPSEARDKSILRLLKGRLLLWVRHILGDSTLEVHTSIGVAGVRGTRFMVIIPNENTMIVGTLEGVVAIRSIETPEKTVLVREMEAAMIRRGAYPTEPRRVTQQEHRDLRETLELKWLEEEEKSETKSDRRIRDVTSGAQGMRDHSTMSTRPMTPTMIDRSSHHR